MNATLKKFGDPETRIKQFERWVVLLRPQQVTLGSLVLIATEPATAFSMLSQEAFVELHEVTGQIEKTLSRAFSFDKINYLMLMMVDPDVHFHIFPRYAKSQPFAGQDFHDYGWPGPPDLKQLNLTNSKVNQGIMEHLKKAWNQ